MTGDEAVPAKRFPNHPWSEDARSNVPCAAVAHQLVCKLKVLVLRTQGVDFGTDRIHAAVINFEEPGSLPLLVLICVYTCNVCGIKVDQSQDDAKCCETDGDAVQ